MERTSDSPPEGRASRVIARARRFGMRAFDRSNLGATLLLLAAAVVFVVMWRGVLVGHETLVGGDILRNFQPWNAGAAPVAPRNGFESDPVTQFLPWLSEVRQQLASGRLPLWNPNAFGGAPLLANDQSAVLSPFTWVTFPFTNIFNGYSIAMLLKLVVGGVGMGLFLRQLRAGRTAAVVAGIAYAGSSFIVVWLGHPHAAVAALFVWAFASVEWWLRTRGVLALAGLAVAVALQFFAGHAETTLHLGVFLAFYSVVRAVAQDRRRWTALGGIALAAALGSAIAAVQLAPFVAELAHSTVVANRTAQVQNSGLSHLTAGDLVSWLVPNGHGNPGIDALPGRVPNYLEATGFIGVGALLLSGVGLLSCLRRQRRSLAVAFGVPVIVAAGTVYGPLTPIIGRVPLLSTSFTPRMLAIICLALTALAGLGFQALLDMRPQRLFGRWTEPAGVVLVAAGIAALAAVIALGLDLALRGAAVETMFGSVHNNIGFWLVVSFLSAVAATSLIAASLVQRVRRVAAGALACLVLTEAAMFAGPFQPRVPIAQALPPSDGMAFLQTHAGNSAVAAQALDLIPNLATEYGLRDARGYDITIDPRIHLFWSHADPHFDDTTYYSKLSQPGNDWLAAAGVRLYMSTATGVPSGATPVMTTPAYVISQVSGTRPFAFAASAVRAASDSNDAVAQLGNAPLGPVIVETTGAVPPAGQATVHVTRQDPGAVDLDVVASGPATVVVLQSYTADWVAQVDGATTALHPADVLFQAVTVGAGHHLVTLRYQPASVTVGLAGTIGGLVATAALLLAPPMLRRRRRGRALSRM